MPQIPSRAQAPRAEGDEPRGGAKEGLRERRRRETAREIHEAAIACFEELGPAGATVALIAERAGVSSRTFFRYYSGKEQAVLPGQHALREALVGMEDQPAGSAVTFLVQALGRVIANDPNSPQEHRRIGALMEAEPLLRAHVASEDDEIVRDVARRLVLSDPALDRDDARLIAELAMSSWRVAWTAWDRDGATGKYPTPLTRWEGARRSLVTAASAVAGEAPSSR